MKRKRLMHISMLNSYNLILDKASLDDIIKSGLAIFSHAPDEIPTIEDVQDMVTYFSSIEMFEHCADLIMFIEENFNDDGSSKFPECECEYPSITNYSKKVKCSTCNNVIVK